MTVLLDQAAVTAELVALERQAMDGWTRGDPDPNLAISAEDVMYIDSGLPAPLEGLAAVKAFFDAYRGKPFFDGHDIVDAKTQVGVDMAVLTYRLILRKGAEATPYYATEVYQRRDEGWKVIHSHFSKVKQQAA